VNSIADFAAASVSSAMTQRELELAGIVSAYNAVTDRLKVAHERLTLEVGRLHDELKRKNEELRRSERLAALGQMAAGLAHEIRNPLGGIALYASMLERSLAGQATAATATKIFKGVRDLEDLVREILEFAQEDRVDARDCNINLVTQRINDALTALAEKNGVAVEMTVSGDTMYCDPERIHRALANLVVNAIQAAGERGWVRVAVQSDDDGVEIEVTDSGPGIPADHLPRIFNPFFTTKSSGTGLGLAICHRIIEAHQGVLRAGNLPGGGARFVVRLPRRQVSVQGEEKGSGASF
jgi:signal transduction histidine kinase